MSSDVVEVFDDGNEDIVEVVSSQSVVENIESSTTFVEVTNTPGIQGTQGTIGLQGYQGLQGSAGFLGGDGIQGPVGIQGIQGVQGVQGFQGLQGTLGIQGIRGVQGVQGLQGLQGVLGDQGIYIGATAPANTSILWADTSSPGTAMTYVLVLSQAEYDSIAVKDPYTLYVVI